MTNRVKKFISLALLLLMSGGFFPQAIQATPPSNVVGPTLYIDPPQAIVKSGQDITVAVKARNLGETGFYGAQIVLTFDAGHVQVVDGDPAQDGVQVTFPAGSSFEGAKYFVGRNLVDNGNGKISFTITLQQPSAPITDEGTLFFITWHAIKEGWSKIDFAAGKLVDKDGQALSVVTEHSFIGENTLMPVTGQVKLQGRQDGEFGQTLVTLTADPCLPTLPYSISNTQGKVQTTGVKVDAERPHTYTDEHGNFSLIPDRNNTYQCLLVYQKGYLVGEHSVPQDWYTSQEQANLGTITLPGGDVTNDDVINIFDLVKVASHMSPGPYDPQVDINGDQQVDISDLAITAGNFGLCGPLSKWSF